VYGAAPPVTSISIAPLFPPKQETSDVEFTTILIAAGSLRINDLDLE